MKHGNNLVFFAPLAVWLLDQAFFFSPTFFYSALALGSLILVWAIKRLADQSSFSAWLFFLPLPLLFFVFSSLYASLLVGRFWVQLLFLVNFWFLSVYFKRLSRYFSNPDALNRKFLEDRLLDGVWFSIFVGASSLFGLPAFVSQPFFLMLSFFLLAVLLLWAELLPLQNKRAAALLPVLLVAWLVFGALVGVLFFLPLNFNVLGLLAALFAYFLIKVNILFWQNNLNRRALRWPLIMSIILSIILLLTARWL